MKLLLITQAVDPRDSVLGFFCEWVERIAHDARVSSVDVWCLRERDWERKPDNVTVHVLPKGKLPRIQVLFSKLVWTDADTVFVHMVPVWTALGGWLWRLRGKRVVLWYTHGHPSIWLRLSLPFVHRVLTATPKAFPIETSKMYSPGHGISPKFSSVFLDREPSDHLRFVGVGRISPSKQVIETIKFFEQILRHEPRAELRWIGGVLDEDGKIYEQEAKAYLREKNLEQCVRFLGPRPHAKMPDIFSSSDLLIHFSKTGSLDKVAIEALMSGCSVFSTNPAVSEVSASYYWDGKLNEESVLKAISLAKRGVTSAEQRAIDLTFNLDNLINDLVRCFID